MSIGFAIPAGTVVWAVEQLLDKGKVTHSFLGVDLRTLTPEIARSLDVEAEAGAIIISTVRGGPAADAGLRRGDVITAFAGEPVPQLGGRRRPAARPAAGHEDHGGRQAGQVHRAVQHHDRRGSSVMSGRAARQGSLKTAAPIGVEARPIARDHVRWRSGPLRGAHT